MPAAAVVAINISVAWGAILCDFFLSYFHPNYWQTIFPNLARAWYFLGLWGSLMLCTLLPYFYWKKKSLRYQRWVHGECLECGHYHEYLSDRCLKCRGEIPPMPEWWRYRSGS